MVDRTAPDNEVGLVWPGKPSRAQALEGPSFDFYLERRGLFGGNHQMPPAIAQRTNPTTEIAPPDTPEPWHNLLIRGDNLAVMRSLLPTFHGKIAAIYVDPPFSTGADMALGLRGRTKQTTEPATRDIPAYRDRWVGGKSAFLSMLMRRFWLMRELLSDTGLLIAHFDDNAGHEVKLLLDEVFGQANKRGEIIWHLGTGAKSRKFFSVQHNYLWVYSKTDNWNFYPSTPELREPFAPSSLQTHFRHVDNEGRRYRKRTIGGKHYIYYADEGRMVGSVWTDIPSMIANSPIMPESTGYPTQKPEKLLHRILGSCTKPGDLVADFFCGSGTTLVVAQKRNLKWIGCDNGSLAIHTCVRRFLSHTPSKPLTQTTDHTTTFDVLSLRPRALDVICQQVTQTRQNSTKSPEIIANDTQPLVDLYRHSNLEASATSNEANEPVVLVYPDTGPVDRDTLLQITQHLMKGNDNDTASSSATNLALFVPELHVLAWEFGPGPHHALVREILYRTGMRLRLITVPECLALSAESMPEAVVFYELAQAHLTLQRPSENTIQITLQNYVFPSRNKLSKKLQTRFARDLELVQDWSVDYDYQGIFVDRWHSSITVTSKRPHQRHSDLVTTSPEFARPAENKREIMVRIRNILGNEIEYRLLPN